MGNNPIIFNLGISLFDNLCALHNLRTGYQLVKKNKGRPGIDGISIETFNTNLEEELLQLQKELTSWTYEPQPVRRVEIPKPDGGVRLLGVPNVRDRVVQATIKYLLEPLLDPGFSDHSYGFRPGKSQEQAVKRVQTQVKTGRKWIVDIDLSKFFDRVHHDRLISRLSERMSDKRILRIIGLTLRSGVMVDGLKVKTEEGTTQGSPLSPLLSNLVLDELDKELESRGLEFCRFADDCNIQVKSEQEAEKVMQEVCEFIERKLKLVVNRDKSQVRRSEGVKFLGMTIDRNKRRCISRKSMKRAMEKVRELTPRNTSWPIEITMQKINQWYVGWSNYYGMTEYPKQLLLIEAHIRRRLRAQFVKQQKKKRNLFSKLIKRGVNKVLAIKTAFSNRGIWALSKALGVERAYSNRWFALKLGFKTIAEEERSEWLNLRRFPAMARG